MPSARVVNLTRGTAIAEKLREAGRAWERARGLIASPPLKDGEGLLLDPTNWIFSFGMSYPIDVLYLDRDFKVVAVTNRMPPNLIGPWVRKARMVLELPVGSIAKSGTQIGDQLRIERAIHAQPG